MEEEASLQSRRFNDEGARACSNAEMEGSSPPEVTGGYSEATSAAAGAGGYPSSFGGGGGARYKLMSPAKLPIARSPCTLTIPPGLSPTSFLESPVMLSNIKAEPSPTTGTFSLPLLMQGSGETSGFPWMGNRNNINTMNDPNSSNFEFQFHPGPSAASAQKVTGISVSSSFSQHRQVLDSLRSSCVKPVVLVGKESSFSAPAPSQAEPNGSSHKSHPSTNNRPSSSDYKDSTPSAVSDRSSEDGYNWRKYGQKLVKGSEFPRSYYKCTYPNCEVKKIFERAPDGQITEIVYKGSHDHPKPQPSRRFTPGTLVPIQEERFDKELASTGQEDKLSINSQPGSAEPNSTPVPSPQQENEDGADGTPQLQCVNEDGEEEDPYAKRRKLDGTLEITPVVKPIREPRVVVQTVSEVDILDDGYRWRKYGQKVVRGNPNPRSYYKCTHAGCPVRKHVERASHDPKAVITTYEGKHNHDVPTARTSSHEMAGPTNTASGMSMARMRPEDNNDHHPISLDLGVGRSYGSDFRAENQAGQLQMLNSEHGYSHASGTASTRVVVQACYNGNINMYASRENMADGNGYENAALQAQSQHQQNIGRVLMGP